MEVPVLFVLCGAIFLEGIDISMMGVALPSIRAELGLSTAALQWVVSAYVLGYGGFVLLGGRASDVLGRRRMFLTALVVFVLFSGVGGLATEGWMLVLARFMTGLAAAFMTPAGLSIITTSFPEGPRRNRALLIYSGIAAGGFSLGVVVGGLLTAIDWRWVFFAPVLLATAILVAAVRMIPREGRVERATGGFDLAGAISLTAGMLLLVFAIVRAPDVPLVQTIAIVAVSLALLAAFVVVERRSPAPLLRLGMLRSAPLIRANVGALVLVGAFVGFQFILVLYLQELRGWSPIETGLVILVCAIDTVLAPTLTPPLVNRFGKARVMFAGLLLSMLAYALLLPLGPDWSYLAMLPMMIIIGLSFTLSYGPLTIAATDGIAEHEQGVAGGVLTMSFQFGAALGLAVTTAVNVAATAGRSAEAMLDGYRTALIVPLVAAGVGVVVTAFGLRARSYVETSR